MKKSLMVILAAAALPLLAGQHNMLATFSTKGPDCYADGTVVKDGECYALVWTHTNAVFQGITVDGKAVGSQDENRVLCIAPLAKDGHCREVVVEINKVLADLYAGSGTFSLHLLDTRKAAVTPAILCFSRKDTWITGGSAKVPSAPLTAALIHPCARIFVRSSGRKSCAPSTLIASPSYAA